MHMQTHKLTCTHMQTHKLKHTHANTQTNSRHGHELVDPEVWFQHGFIESLTDLVKQVCHGLAHATHVSQQGHQLTLGTKQGGGKVWVPGLNEEGVLRAEGVGLLVEHREHMLDLGVVALQEELHTCTQGRERDKRSTLHELSLEELRTCGSHR